MAVVGRHCIILNHTGKSANVNPFTPDYDALANVPIVDAAIAYDCPYTGLLHILLIQNALSIPSMTHNLIPPFIMRKANVEVHDTPKIHVANPTNLDHSLFFPAAAVRIPLSLSGIFSFFPSRCPTLDELNLADEVLLLTPDGHSWNPYSTAYANNEASMLDWEGNLTEPTSRHRYLVESLPDYDDAWVSSITISPAEHAAIDASLCPLPLALDSPLPYALAISDVDSLAVEMPPNCLSSSLSRLVRYRHRDITRDNNSQNYYLLFSLSNVIVSY